MKNIVVVAALAATLVSCSGKDNGKKEYENAVSLANEGNYADAAEAYKEAIDKNNENADYYIGYGAVLIKLNQYEEAVKNFDKATTHDATKYTKAGIRGKGIAYYEAGDYQNAINNFVKALSMDVAHSLDDDINYYLAEAYSKNGQYDEAEAVYSEMIEASKKDAGLYIKRAKLYETAGKYDKCMADFDKAISLEKREYGYYIEKAKVQIANEKDADAKATLGAALEVKAKSDEARYQVALVYYYMEDRVNAIATLEGIKEKYPDAYELLGDIYYNASDYKQAAAQYECYLREVSSKDTSETSYKLSSSYINLGDYASAKRTIDAALQAKNIEDIKRLKYNQVIVYENSADFNTAYDLAKAYLETYPDDEDMARELVFLKTRYSG